MSSSPLFFDRVQAVSTTTGTGTYTLGSPVTGFQAFAIVGDGKSCYYCAHEVDANGNPSGGWEVGLGTYTASGTTLSRDTILASTNTNAAVSWSAGTRRLLLVAPASLFAQLQAVTEIAITSGGTLTSTAWGQSYVCSGTTADYTVVLPTAAGHAGERIRIRMADALTKLVTLDGNASETLDGSLTRILWAGESCELRSDGTNLVKVGGVTKPFTAVLSRTTNQTLTSATWTALVMNTQVSGAAVLYDSVNGRVAIPRPGLWSVQLGAHLTSVAGSAINYLGIGLSSATPTLPYTQNPNVSTSTGSTDGTTIGTLSAVAGDYVAGAIYATGGAPVVDASTPPFLAVAEVGPW